MVIISVRVYGHHLRFWNLDVVLVVGGTGKVGVIEVLNVILVSLVFGDQRLVELLVHLWVSI